MAVGVDLPATNAFGGFSNAWKKARHAVFACPVRCCLVANVCAGTGDGNVGPDDASFGTVGYTTAEGYVRGLSGDCFCKQRRYM